MREHKKGIIIGVVIGAILLIILGTFLILARNYFMGKFPEKATFCGTDVSGLTTKEATETLNNAKVFSIKLVKDGNTTDVNASEAVDRKFNENTVEEGRKNISIFDYAFGKEAVAEIKPESVKVDDAALKQLLIKNVPTATKYTADAYFNKEMTLVPEVQGDNVNMGELVGSVKTTIEKGGLLEFVLNDFYYKPQIKASDEKMISLDNKIKKYRSINITIKFGKYSEVIDGSLIGDNMVYSKGKISMKKGWINKFVKKLAKKYDTYGITRKFKPTKSKKTIKIKGGTLGWLLDQPALKKKLKNLFAKKQSATIKPKYLMIGKKHNKANDIGNTYVEVSLAKQCLWYYEKGKLKAKGPIVSGLPTKDRITHVGVHRLYAKQRDRYLGTIAVQGYHTHVNYWMPFNAGQGLHDAVWRSRFGGTLYRGGGSHGCVNLPLSLAAKLYGLLKVGTPVVVY